MTASGDLGTKARRAVMADVAKLAGVSHQTVSRVINSSDLVKDDTRERVLAAMRMLDYRPNSVARALATGKSKTLGVLSFDNTLYGPASTLVGVERAAHRAGYFISIVSLLSLDRSAVLDAVERLRAQGVDGILVIAPQTADARAVSELPHDLPVVAVEAGPDQGVPVASVDQFAGAALATQHLLDLGSSHGLAHRRPGRLAGGAAAGLGLAVDARGCRRAGSTRAGRRLEREVGLRARPAAGGGSGGDRGLRRQRPDGIGALPCLARGRP